MKLLKFLLPTLFLFSSYISNGQSQLDIRTYSNGDPIIALSLSNLLKIVEMTNSDFETIMSTYNYKYDKEDCYLWQGGGLMAGLYSICKSPGFGAFIWTEKVDMATTFKDELEKYFSGYRDGKPRYRILYNDHKYEITWYSNDPGGTVTIKRMFD